MNTNMDLALKHPHPRDARIVFDEGPHVYYVDGCSDGYISSTTLIHSFFPPFDKECVATMTYKKYSNVPGHKYEGMSVQDIIDLWSSNTAAEEGTKLHHDIEDYINGKDVSNDSPEFGYFLDFRKDFPEYVPYRTEWTIFDDVHKISGSVDIVFEGSNGGIILGDWKRSKEIRYSNNYQKGLNGLEHVQDCNFNHYALQLNLYRTILEEYYDQTVEDMFLVVLHPNNDTYIKVQIPRIEEDIQTILQKRV